MIIKGLLLKFLSTHKIVYLYIFLSCISVFLQVIISSMLYRKFLDKNISEHFYELIKQICTLWITMFIIYFIRSKLECNISPDITTFLRRELIVNYLETNEVIFNDKETEKDNVKMLDIGYLSQKIFMWICESLIPIGTIILFMNIYFLIKCPAVGIINFISNILNLYIIKTYYPKLMDKIEKRRNEYQKLILNIGEDLNNLINIYTSGKLNDTIDKNDSIINEYKQSLKDEMNIVCEFVNVLRTNVYISTVLSIIALFRYTKNISHFFEIFSIFVLYIPVFQNVISDIPNKSIYFTDLSIIMRNFTKQNKITVDENGYLASPSYKYKYDRSNLNQCSGGIIFDNITYSYNNNKYIFKNFSEVIKPNEKVGIMAESGRGKTTLMKLLLNFIKPQSGHIFLDGIDISEINHRELRSRISYINQKTLMLNDTIMNNLKYGNNKNDTEIISFLQKYGFDKMFSNLNDMIDMNGKNMSMGMQKIIYLVRSILNNNHCIYIFDEPLSSLDENNRSSVIKMIEENTKNKTVIVITHDKEILDILDRVINF